MSESPNSPYHLLPAAIEWTDDGVPQSAQFGDVYFSRAGGLDETRYVFLQQNHLDERWRGLDAAQPGCFCIGETGFGTGLNFLAAWQLWQQVAPASWRLHVVSVEKHPVQREQLQRALELWPELKALGEQLLANYPPALPGQHRLQLEGGRVTLDLLFGDASDGLASLLDTSHPLHAQHCGAKIDAWFLDGFAPASNPEMWRPELFRCMALLSHAGTTAATFTAAGIVKRGLRDHGFSIAKVPGWGRKRDMLTAVYTGSLPSQDSAPHGEHLAWHSPSAADTSEVVVVGAGLAGAHTAQALARRGIRVTVLERESQPALGASGNPQGILYTKLSPRLETLNQFTLASYLYALRHYAAPLAQQGEQLGAACGALQLMRSERDRGLLDALREQFQQQDEWVQFVDAARASELAGIAVSDPAVYFPGAGYLVPPKVCATALDHPLITVRSGVDVASLERSDKGWELRGADGETLASATTVVLANSFAARELAPCHYLPLKTIRGQLSYLNADQFTALPNTVICHEGYLAPAQSGTVTIGATFDLSNKDCELRDGDHRDNIEQLRRALPGLLTDSAATHGGRAALRCASPDYLPIVGAVPDFDRFCEDFAGLRRNAKSRLDVSGSYLPGLYINSAHGSRGLTSTPLCAEVIASLITNEPRPLSQTVMKALSPARFLVRDLIRKRI